MKNRTIVCALVSACAATGISETACGQELHSIDFTPVEDTSWADSPSTVRLNFGEGIGYGTVTFTSVNGGVFDYVQAPFAYNDLRYSSYNGPTTLSNGAVFAPAEEIVFQLLPGSATEISGFTMSVTLDSGSFTDGSMFSVRSLGHVGDQSQYLVLNEGLLSPDAVQLPTDGSVYSDMVLVDPVLGYYGPSSQSGAANGLAFGITGNTFSATFLTSPGFQPGGVAMTIVRPDAVPEPSAAVLGSVALLALLRRRRNG